MSALGLREGGVAARIREHRLIVVLRRIEPRDSLVALVDELAEAGARIFEVTLDAAEAASSLAALRAHLPAGFLVAAGTVRRPDQLDAAREAGADFVVSPTFDAGLVEATLAAGLPSIPGCLTPTEIAAAWATGATFVKLFPASVAGPALVRELRGPMPEVQLIPTGGVGARDVQAFLDAGAAAIGLGGGLVKADAVTRRSLIASITGETEL